MMLLAPPSPCFCAEFANSFSSLFFDALRTSIGCKRTAAKPFQIRVRGRRGRRTMPPVWSE